MVPGIDLNVATYLFPLILRKLRDLVSLLPLASKYFNLIVLAFLVLAVPALFPGPVCLM